MNNYSVDFVDQIMIVVSDVLLAVYRPKQESRL